MLWAGKDYRVAYIIWNERISNPDIENGAWRPYTGSNPHTMHLHLSVKKEGCEDPQEWTAVPVTPVFKQAGPMPKIRRGEQGIAVEVLQSMLGIAVDGYFGAETETAVMAAQKEAGIVVDGICGSYTWGALAES
jgi:peptidoglycan hydrolase-like protein with peptidoglycan-binding domain